MRRLATIRKINKLLPIHGKDRIQLAVIDGWTVIVKKDEFKENDKCVFFEIDSFLPMDECYSFLKSTTYQGKEGYRIKTMKMAGVLSQGLALPLHTVLSAMDANDPKLTAENTNLTDYLSIVKYDVADNSTGTKLQVGNAEGKFPSFIPKTDQERIQNLTNYFDIMKSTVFEETLKLDGSSMTCYKLETKQPKWQQLINKYVCSKLFKPRYHFGVCSRNLEIKKPTANIKSDFWNAAIKYQIEKRLPSGFAIQGELIGPKIQNNHEKVSELEYYVFDVYDIINERYLLPSERHRFCSDNNINHIPVTSSYYLPFTEHNSLQDLLTHVEGQSINPDTVSEGRVYKSTENPNISFKVISNKYLLKCEQ